MRKSKKVPSRGKKCQPVAKTRKEIRKEKREVKKQHRHDHYTRAKVAEQNLLSKEKKGTESDSINNVRRRCIGKGYVRPGKMLGLEGEQKMKNRSSDSGNLASDIKSKRRVKSSSKLVYEDPLVARKMEEEAVHVKLREDMRKTRNHQLYEANEEEEKLIKKLEKQLKLKNRKSKSVPKSFTADGLDYILDVCDSDKVKQVASIEKTFDSTDSELEEDLALVTSKGDNLACRKQSHSLLQQPGPSDHNRKCDGSNFSEGIASGISNNKSDDFSDGSNSGNFREDINGSDNVNNNEQPYCHEKDHVTNSNETSKDGRLARKHFNDSEDAASDENERSLFECKKRKRVRVKDDDEDDCSSRSKLIVNCGKKPSKKIKISQNVKRKVDVMDFIQPFTKKLKVTKDSFNEPGRYVRKYDTEESSTASDDGENKDNEMFLPEELSSIHTEEDSSMEEEEGSRSIRDKPESVSLSSQHGAYVPPSLRTSTSAEDACQQRLKQLKRRVKGLLNRLSERNLCSVSKEISELFHDIAYSRNDMNTTLTTSLMESLVTPVLSLERLVMEHIALVSYLHYQEGSEVGAFILQAVVKKFDTLFKSNPDIENKELDNVIMIMCFFYHFKVIHARLLFDMVSCLADRFGPKDVELILLMLRSVGFGLRKDNPARMKLMMIQLQKLANSSLQKCNEPRIKFMLEVLVAVKNNNMARLPGWDPTPVNNMRKVLRTLPSHQSSMSSELNISLEDILAADERGRWWVIGSAWAGQGPTESEPSATKDAVTYSSELVKLAEKMRMNSTIRRKIFYILMSSQDSNEAAANILQMGLKGMLAHDIIHVTLDTCLQEVVYNPYYCFLLQTVCERNRELQMTLQMDFWNKFDDLHALTPSQFTNVVKLLHQLLNLEVISLLVFKVIAFTRLDKPTVRLLRQVLLGVLSGDQEICNKVFLTITKNQNYKMFCQRLHLFLQQYVISRMSPKDPKKLFLQERVNNMFPHDL